MVLLGWRPVRGFRREHVELGDELEDFLHVHGKRPQLRVNRCVRLLEALRLLRVVQVTDTLLYELCYVCDLGQNLRIGAPVNEALQIRVNCLNIVLVLIVDVKLIQFLDETGLFLVKLGRELKFKLLLPLFKLLDHL